MKHQIRVYNKQQEDATRAHNLFVTLCRARQQIALSRLSSRTLMTLGFASKVTSTRLQPKEHGSRAGTDRRVPERIE